MADPAPKPISLDFHFTKGGATRGHRVGVPGSFVTLENGEEQWTIPAASMDWKPEVGSWFREYGPRGSDARKRTVTVVAKSTDNLSYILTVKVV